MNGRDPQNRFGIGLVALVLVAGTALVLGLAPKWDHPWDPITSTDWGPPGIAMNTFTSERTRTNPLDRLPTPWPPADPIGQTAGEVYENVQVLRDVDAAEFDRLMLAITEWVSPQAGCEYCHDLEQGFAYDGLYTKTVARVMLAMTEHINADWAESHVGPTGVTCYTCHRGNPVPPYHWYKAGPLAPPSGGMVGMPAPWVRTANTIRDFIPREAFEHYLLEDRQITGSSPRAVFDPKYANMQDMETIYLLMMQMSDGMGVNCNFCHNSRALWDWQQSTPNRVVGWHAIRMTRELNQAFISPLSQVLPPIRLGPMGDSPKIDCATCHVGQPKPLGGYQMVAAYPELTTLAPAIADEVRDWIEERTRPRK